MNIKQLRVEVVRPVLQKLDLWNREAEDLLIGTACQESSCGYYIRQLNCEENIGAFGIYQMELATADDIFTNFLDYKQILKEKVLSFKTKTMDNAENLKWNLAYSTAMCRIHYYRVKEQIPAGIYGQAQFWKKYYNTEYGKGTIEEYLHNWQKYNG